MLREIGASVEGEHPVMNGKPQRIRTEGKLWTIQYITPPLFVRHLEQVNLWQILGYNQIIRPLESLVTQLMPYMQTVSFVILVTAFVRNNVEGEVHGRESRKLG